MSPLAQKIMVGITGASGSLYAYQLLKYLKENTPHEIHIVASPNGYRIFKEELNLNIQDMGYPVVSHKEYDIPCVSGSNTFDQLVIIPGSMGTIARIAHGLSTDTLTRTADVIIKEKRKLIIVPRETPFSLIHLENLKILALNGAIIIPAIPSFYSHPATVEELAATVTSRVLDHMGISNNLMKRWMQS
ncbi:MAG: 3-polyprenyl-4-hydroxybenzoate decarboxylase [uncultured bacterium]|nr:MAG: 3-polyprenyl-4-hydroxybenzoate decarboxylase [uncultured bacterium]